MPPEMLRLPRVKRGQIFELSEPATNFLLNLARNAYSDNTRPIKSADSDSTSEIEECLTDEALKWIMSVLPETASNPWVNPPNFQVLLSSTFDSRLFAVLIFILLVVTLGLSRSKCISYN
jgi:hypothetical protein